MFLRLFLSSFLSLSSVGRAKPAGGLVPADVEAVLDDGFLRRLGELEACANELFESVVPVTAQQVFEAFLEETLKQECNRLR